MTNEKLAIDVRLHLDENKERLLNLRNLIPTLKSDPKKLDSFKEKGQTYINLCKVAERFTKDFLKDKLTLSARNRRILDREVEETNDLLNTVQQVLREGISALSKSEPNNSKITIDVRLQLKANQELLSNVRSLIGNVENNETNLDKFKNKAVTYINLCKTALRHTTELMDSKLTLTAGDRRILKREIEDTQDLMKDVERVGGVSNIPAQVKAMQPRVRSVENSSAPASSENPQIKKTKSE